MEQNNTNPYIKTPNYRGFDNVAPTAPISSGSGKSSRFSFSILPLIIVAVLSAGISAGITYFIMKRNSEPSIFSTEEIPESSDVNIVSVVGTTGNETEEEVFAQIDQKIASSTSDADENFDDIMTKVAFLFDFEKYDEVKTTLDGISLDGLSNFQLYQVYNSYARYYNLVGDSASAKSYESRAADAKAKYIVE